MPQFSNSDQPKQRPVTKEIVRAFMEAEMPSAVPLHELDACCGDIAELAMTPKSRGMKIE